MTTVLPSERAVDAAARLLCEAEDGPCGACRETARRMLDAGLTVDYAGCSPVELVARALALLATLHPEGTTARLHFGMAGAFLSEAVAAAAPLVADEALRAIGEQMDRLAQQPRVRDALTDLRTALDARHRAGYGGTFT